MRAELTDELPHLRRYAMSLARQKDEADDLVQECLVKALAAADKFEPGTNLRAWLFTILRNAFINKTRDRARANALTDGMAKLYGMSSPPAQHSIAGVARNDRRHRPAAAEPAPGADPGGARRLLVSDGGEDHGHADGHGALAAVASPRGPARRTAGLRCFGVIFEGRVP